MSPRHAAPPVPPLAERQKPGLSETLSYDRRPDVCQACGITSTSLKSIALRVWLESDEWDRDTSPPVYVVLCNACSGRLIDSHPRMYREQERLAPNLGAMELCVGCALRDGLRCTASLSMQNGGPGMEIRYKTPPMHAHVRGTHFCGWKWMYPGPAVFCAGRVPVDSESSP